jgi:hypothetical protein
MFKTYKHTFRATYYQIWFLLRLKKRGNVILRKCHNVFLFPTPFESKIMFVGARYIYIYIYISTSKQTMMSYWKILNLRITDSIYYYYYYYYYYYTVHYIFYFFRTWISSVISSFLCIVTFRSLLVLISDGVKNGCIFVNKTI